MFVLKLVFKTVNDSLQRAPSKTISVLTDNTD